jgi:hypothetical protein
MKIESVLSELIYELIYYIIIYEKKECYKKAGYMAKAIMRVVYPQLCGFCVCAEKSEWNGG